MLLKKEKGKHIVVAILVFVMVMLFVDVTYAGQYDSECSIDSDTLTCKISSGSSNYATVGDTVTWSVKVKKNAVVNSLYLKLRSPSGKEITSHLSSNGTGLYEDSMLIKDGHESGKWICTYFRGSCEDGSSVTMNGDEDYPIFYFIVGGTNPDSTPPTIDESSFNVIISGGKESALIGDEIIWSVRASDDSEMGTVYVKLSPPQGSAEYFEMFYNEDTEQYEYSMQVTEETVPGQWKAREVKAYDIFQNKSTISATSASPLGQATVEDEISPIIDKTSFYKIMTRGGIRVYGDAAVTGYTVTWSIMATDNDRIKNVRLLFTSKQGTEYSVPMVLNSKTQRYEKELEINTQNEYLLPKGEYCLTKIIAEDRSGNQCVVEDGLSSGDVNIYYSMGELTVSEIPSFTYTGQEFRPEPVVKRGSITLKKNIDYELSYSNNVRAGTAKVILTGKGKYHGTRNCEFTIAKKSINPTVSFESNPFEYTGKKIKPEQIIVKDGNTTLEYIHDYTLSFCSYDIDDIRHYAKECRNPGKYDVKVTLCGSYEGSSPLLFFDIVEWGTPSYKWASNNDYVTATRVCGHDSSIKEDEKAKVKSTITKKATFATKGQTTYTATFKNPAFKTQSRVFSNIPKLAMTVKATKKTIKYKKIKKKAQTVNIIKVKKAQGKVTYKVVGGNAKAKKALKLNTKNGKITIKKKTRTGTYKIKVKVTAAGNAKYKSGSKTVWVTVKVK